MAPWPTSWCSWPLLQHGQDLWLASNQPNTAKVTECVWFHVCGHMITCRRLYYPSWQEIFLAGFEEAMGKPWESPCGTKVRATFSQQPERNRGSQYRNLQRTKFFQKACWFGSRLFPSQTWKESAPWWTPWLQVCEALKQRTCLHLTYGLLNHGNHDMIKVCYFKPLSFRWYC